MLKTHWTTQTARSVSFQTNPLFLFYYLIFLLRNGSFILSPLRPSGNVCFTFSLQQFQQINESHNIVLGPMLIILQDVGRYRLTFYSNVTLTHSMLKNYGRTSSRHLDRDVITWQESLKMRDHEIPPRGGGPYMKGVGMLVVSVRGANFGFWPHL